MNLPKKSILMVIIFYQLEVPMILSNVLVFIIHVHKLLLVLTINFFYCFCRTYQSILVFYCYFFS